jgi:hypothetical protein
MIYAILCNCENGHNIAAMPHDWKHDRAPTDEEFTALCDFLLLDMRREMKEGKLSRACPHCGSPMSGEWGVVVQATNVATMEEMHRHLNTASAKGTALALAALGQRAMKEAFKE